MSTPCISASVAVPAVHDERERLHAPVLADGPPGERDRVTQRPGLGVDLACGAPGRRRGEPAVGRLQCPGPPRDRQPGVAAQERQPAAVARLEGVGDDAGELDAAQPVAARQARPVVQGGGRQALAGQALCLGRPRRGPRVAVAHPDADEAVQGLGVLVVGRQHHVRDARAEGDPRRRRQQGRLHCGATAPDAGDGDAVGLQLRGEDLRGVERRVGHVVAIDDQGAQPRGVSRHVARLPARCQRRGGEEGVVGVQPHPGLPGRLHLRRGGLGQRRELRGGQVRVAGPDEDDLVGLVLLRSLPHRGREPVRAAEGRQRIGRRHQLGGRGGHQAARAVPGPHEAPTGGVHDRTGEGAPEPRCRDAGRQG